MKTNLSIIKSIWLIILLVICSELLSAQPSFTVNKSHLDYLYKEIEVNGRQMAIIHIYSNAPDYKYIDDMDEGYACVDDAARAAIFYLEYFKAYNDSSSLIKYYNLVEFLVYMHAENGFFYNFIWKDNSINKTFKTSVAEPNWWSWRALWALMENYKEFKNSNDDRAIRAKQTIEKGIAVIKRLIPKTRGKTNIDGVNLPNWLPGKTAADQSAVLVLLLSEYYQNTGDKAILSYINSLVQGIMKMQVKYKGYEFNGAFLSWENTWHGWGNSQSYALLKAFPIVKDEKVKKSALYELDNFYEQLIKRNFLSYFKVRKHHHQMETVESSRYSQIAYNIRPMVFALLEAYKITSDSTYAIKAGRVAQWFVGRNPAGEVMYNPHTGIIYDGIENQNLINKNSGAESTIEGLLSLLKISQNPIALTEFENIK
ncbi:MAG: hypothetical protein Q8N83_04955 [Ignavibacteria bacterium]|nr:hypothetical protein [Ignavibacteria bacterium]